MREVIAQTLQITLFVALMMIAVEYLNVLTQGAWHRALAVSGWRQYLAAVLLGAIPGCLGAFVVVTLYTHRMVSIGSVVACMVATSGDEAFVMFAMFPARALLLTAGLVVVGLAAGWATDRAVAGTGAEVRDHRFVLHELDHCRCFPRGEILRQLRQPSPARGILAGATGLFALALLTGQLGPADWNWIRWTLLLVSSLGLFITLTVPEHFLEEHLWHHVVLQHVPRVFGWTLAALAVIAVFERYGSLSSLIGENRWGVLAAAGLLGVVPESGPHLLFVTLYDRGAVPLSVLLTSSIVQDGHGMLPLLAASRMDFVKVKSVNLVTGLTVGALFMALGW